jgi:hypothetical protein
MGLYCKHSNLDHEALNGVKFTTLLTIIYSSFTMTKSKLLFFQSQSQSYLMTDGQSVGIFFLVWGALSG